MVRKIIRFLPQRRGSALWLALFIGTIFDTTGIGRAQAAYRPGTNDTILHAKGQAVLRWNAGDRTVTSVVPCGEQTPFSAGVRNEPTPQAFDTTGLIPGHTYYVLVPTGDVSLEHCLSASERSLAQQPLLPPAGPSTLTAVAGNAAVSLTWSAVTTDIAGNPLVGPVTYNVYGGTATPPAAWPFLLGGVSGLSCVCTGLTDGSTYTFIVTASTAQNSEGAASGPASAVPQASDGPSASFVDTDTVTQGNWIGAYAVTDPEGTGEVIAGDPNQEVTSIKVTDGGSGYTQSNTTVTISEGAGTGASAIAHVTNGVVTSIVVTAGGIGYASRPHVSIVDTSDASAGGATATAEIAPTVPLPAYVSAINATGIDGAGAVATAALGTGSQSGKVAALNLTQLGSGYNAAPNVALVGGGGSGATATASVVSGSVTSLTLSAPGSGYTSAPAVVFSTNDNIPGTTAYSWSAPAPASTNGAMQEIGHPTIFQASAFNTTPATGAANYVIPLGTDTAKHTLSLYLLDYGNSGANLRSETVTLTDAFSGNVLGTVRANSFVTGIYYTWNVQGPGTIAIAITSANTMGSVLSGIFFGGGPVPGVPGAPTVEAAVNSLALSWIPSADAGADHYNIYRSTSSTGAFTLLTSVATPSYDNTGLSPGITYYYQVSGVNHGTEGALSAPSIGTAAQPDEASVKFIASDDQTHGLWGGRFGSDGVYILGDAATEVPAYLASTNINSGNSSYKPPMNANLYGSFPATPPALATVASGGVGPAVDHAVWYTTSPAGMSIDLNETGSYAMPSLASIAVISGGSNYGTTAPTVTISAPQLPGGVQATAAATVTGGAVTSITLVNAGSGYTSVPTITLAPPPSGGNQATASATLSGPGPRQLALYLLDGPYTGTGSNGRSETVTFTDASVPGGPALSEQAVTDFSDGRYLVYNISGHVTVTITGTGGANAVVSGFFFDPAAQPPPPTGLTVSAGLNAVDLAWTASSESVVSYNVYRASSAAALTASKPLATGVTTLSYADTSISDGSTYWYAVSGVNWQGAGSQSSPVSVAPTATATYVETDTTTSGHWTASANGYGSDGYEIVGGGSRAASYASLPGIGGTLYNGRLNLKTPQAPDTGTGGVSNSLNYANTSLTVDLTVTGSTPRIVALYALDYEVTAARMETVQATDGTSGAPIGQSVLLSNFGGAGNGDYVVYRVLGHVKFVVTRVAGANAVIGGVLFGTTNTEPAEAPSLTASPGFSPGTISLNWTSVPDATAYMLFRSTGSQATRQTATAIGTVAGLAYMDTDLTPGASYTYFVDGVSLLGSSPSSNAAETSPSATSVDSPQFLTLDTSTGAAWNGASAAAVVYGTDGFTLFDDPATSGSHPDGGNTNLGPSYGIPVAPTANGSSAGASLYPADPLNNFNAAGPGLQRVDFNSSHKYVDAVAYAPAGAGGASSVAIRLKNSDSGPHPVAIYVEDLGGENSRTETITLSNTLTLAQYPACTQVARAGAAFTNGEYFVWNIPSGDYTVTITRNGGANAVVSAVFFGGGTAPSVPAGLQATGGVQQVNLTWSASAPTGAAPGPVSYRVKRSTAGPSGPFTDILVGATQTGFTDTTVSVGSSYWYVVSAYQGGTESANSAAVETTPVSASP